MTCRCSPALVALRDEVNDLAPDRRKASDGCCGDAAHNARKSDHNADESGFAHAQDITHDLEHGVDCGALTGLLVEARDPRVKYLIWNRRIWRAYDRPKSPSRPFLSAWTPEEYEGPNPHDKHMHVSIVATATHDTGRWFAPHQEDPFEMVYKDANDALRAYVREKYLQYTLRPPSPKDMTDSVAFIVANGADVWLASLTDSKEAADIRAKQKARLGL